jgi:hypothetical protein
MWQMHILETQAVIEAADGVERITPAMARAGVDALNAGSQDTGSLVNKIWLAMTALRGAREL